MCSSGIANDPKNINLSRFQEGTLKLLREWKSCYERLKEFGLFHLLKQRLRRCMAILCKHVHGVNIRKEKELFKLNIETTLAQEQMATDWLQKI